MGKIVDTDNVLKSAEYVIALMKSNPDVHVTEEQHENFKQAFKVVLDMTQAVEQQPKRDDDMTYLADVAHVGEKLLIKRCRKCHGEILSVIGANDYGFCPLCGRQCYDYYV